MSGLSQTSQTTIAFKNLLNKSNTDTAKGLGNESESISFNVHSDTIFVSAISSTTATAIAAGVAVFVNADLTLDGSSNGHAYFASWPVTPPAGTDPSTLSAYAYGAGKLTGITPGDRVKNAISFAFGNGYEAIPYSGSPIPANRIFVNDPRNWVYQYQSGVFFQENLGTVPSVISIYAYTGSILTNSLAGGSLAGLSDVTLASPLISGQALVFDGIDWTNTTVISSLALDDLTDVIITAPTTGQALVYNGVDWINGPIVSPTTLDDLTDVVIGSPLITGQALVYDGIEWTNTTIITSVALDDLTDVIITAPTTGQALIYNGVDWVNTPIVTATSLDDLTDVVIGSPLIAGQALVYDGINWNNSNILLNDISDVVIGSPLIAGQALIFDGVDWVNGSVSASDIGLKNVIEVTDNITVPLNYQYLVYGDLTIQGVMTNNGQVVIVNGALVLDGGTFNNNSELIIANIDTKKYRATFTTVANVPLTLNHNLNTLDFTYQIRQGNDDVLQGWGAVLTRTGVNSVTVTTPTAITGVITILSF